MVSSGLQDQLPNHSTLLPPVRVDGQNSVRIFFQQVPDILSSVTDATQALYPFLTYNKDLVMDVLKKVNWVYSQEKLECLNCPCSFYILSISQVTRKLKRSTKGYNIEVTLTSETDIAKKMQSDQLGLIIFWGWDGRVWVNYMTFLKKFSR